MNNFGERLKALRINKKYTQTQVAKKLNKTKSTISNYENGQKFPSLQTLIELAELFNVSLDYLIGLDKKETISVHGLTDTQIQFLHALVAEFRNTPKPGKKRLSAQQLDLLNDLFIELMTR